VAEADNCIRSLKPSNRLAMNERLLKTRETIAKLGQSMQIRISDEFHKLKISEIQLTADFLKKKEEEKEAEKEIRAQLREEEKVAKEIAAEKSKVRKRTPKNRYGTTTNARTRWCRRRKTFDWYSGNAGNPRID
jgi:NADH dehydrogenase/NADH:ubiquinone oxidoreductase subunit G